MRGSRVQAVVNELQGEKIDIVMWSDNQATFLANALAPAEVSKIFLYEEKNKVEVVIPDEQLSLAIGRKGQNVKLASSLTNLEIDILTEEEEADRRQLEFKEKIQDEELKNLEGINNKMLSLLAKNNIVTLNDFADLATFELTDKEEGIFKNLDIDEKAIDSMIMKAREKWFVGEEQEK